MTLIPLPLVPERLIDRADNCDGVAFPRDCRKMGLGPQDCLDCPLPRCIEELTCMGRPDRLSVTQHIYLARQRGQKAAAIRRMVIRIMREGG